MVVIQRLHYGVAKLSEYFPAFWCYLLFQVNKLNVFAGSFQNLYKDLQKYSEELD